ncbi:MAG TPA: peptidylprolyl isomerase [Verrucomicrobiae bacterium]|jgi:peptidyl-prolyl cis-trans isomerase SurA|nr:peptidylprolyl isomerase [Verrucomicrobiae bacterium]
MLKKSSFIAVVVTLFAVALYADNIVDEIIARVNDQIITRADLQRASQATLEEIKQRFPGDWQAKWNTAEPDVLRDLIDTKCLLEKGKELGITADTELIKQLDEIRKKMNLASIDDLEKAAKEQGVSFEDFKDETRNRIIREQVIGREVGSRIHITNEEVQAFYNEHQKDMEAPEEVQLSEILISIQTVKPAPEKDKPALPDDPAQVAQAEAKARTLLEALRKGAKFEDTAKTSSDGPTAAQGGDIGAFKRGELAKELEDKTFSLKQGELTDVLRTKQGFLILKVVAHHQPGVPPLKTVEEQIRQAIYVQRLEPAARTYLQKCREEAYVEIKPGFTDTGASPNQSKPMVVAVNDPAVEAAKHKKKKHFIVF